MVMKDLEKGQRIFLEVKSGLLKGIYFSTVRRVDSSCIHIDYPFGNNALYLDMCYKLLVYVSYIKKTRGGCKYRFSTQVDSVNFSYPRMLILNTPKSINRIQRRRHLRIPFERDCFFKTLNTPGMLSSMVEKNGYTSNISAGGALMITTGKMTPGTRLKIIIKKDKKTFGIDSTVVRRQNSQNDEILKLYGLEFDEALKNLSSIK